MIPDFEKINERMEQASLKEFMPQFDKEQEWLQLSKKLQPQAKRKPLPVWYYAAAIILILIGSLLITWLASGTHTAALPAPQAALTPALQPAATADNNTPPPAIAGPSIPSNHPDAPKPAHKNTLAIKKHSANHKTYNSVNYYTSKDIIRNGTPCPLEIRISQTMKCPNIQPADISSCSTLEPDQATPLDYKAHNKIAKNCSLTINEIEITSIATGETILLNSSSTPATAQDVFGYITGQKKGDILAGMFNSDCNHQSQKHGLRLNNKYGDLTIE